MRYKFLPDLTRIRTTVGLNLPTCTTNRGSRCDGGTAAIAASACALLALGAQPSLCWKAID